MPKFKFDVRATIPIKIEVEAEGHNEAEAGRNLEAHLSKVAAWKNARFDITRPPTGVRVAFVNEVKPKRENSR